VRIRPLLFPLPPSSSYPGDGGDDGEDGGGDRARDLRPRAYAPATDAENSVVVVVPPPSSHSHSGDHDDATPAQRQRQRRRYAYDRVYGESSDTSRLYVEMVSDIVRSVMGQGRDGTVFTYGQTSTGE
jgi:hypothetical protein